MHKQHMKLRVYSAIEIANMVPWQGDYVPLSDVQRLLDLIEGEEVELDLDDGKKDKLES